MDLVEENQEGEFHTPTLVADQVNKADDTNATMDEEDSYVGKFDVMLDVGALYTNVPGLDHQVFLAGNVAKEVHTNEATSTTLPSPATDAAKEQDPEVTYTLGTTTESS